VFLLYVMIVFMHGLSTTIGNTNRISFTDYITVCLFLSIPLKKQDPDPFPTH
jgi:hypothetical protein